MPNRQWFEILALTVAMYVKKPLTSSILMGLSGPGLAIVNGILRWWTIAHRLFVSTSLSLLSFHNISNPILF